jgi:hypothetical protein
LRHAIGRFAQGFELGFQFFAVQGFDVRRHGGKLSCWRWNSSVSPE